MITYQDRGNADVLACQCTASELLHGALGGEAVADTLGKRCQVLAALVGNPITRTCSAAPTLDNLAQPSRESCPSFKCRS